MDDGRSAAVCVKYEANARPDVAVLHLHTGGATYAVEAGEDEDVIRIVEVGEFVVLLHLGLKTS